MRLQRGGEVVALQPHGGRLKFQVKLKQWRGGQRFLLLSLAGKRAQLSAHHVGGGENIAI